MKLRELARRTDVSTASIKYYIRLGVLGTGEKRNATTAVYGDAHVHRLALITWLRRELALPMSSIAVLTHAIDDETLDNLELMGVCQRLALGLDSCLDSAPEPQPTATPPTEGTGDAAAPPRRNDPDVTTDLDAEVGDVLSDLGWPDVSPTARAAVAVCLRDLIDAGYDVGRDIVMTHATALAQIARENTLPISDSLTRDEIALAVIRGITLHNRLLISMSTLVHAAMSAQARKPRD